MREKRVGLWQGSKVILVFLFVGIIFLPWQGYSEEAIKIGVIRDLTGPHAEAGRSQRDALTMVYDEANATGFIPGHKIDYKDTIGDEKADPDKSTSLAKKFIEADNVLLISCCSTSGAGMAVVKAASEAKVPVTGHAYSTELHKGELGKWYFASGSNNDEIAPAWLEQVKRDGHKKVAVGWVNYAWGRDIRDNLLKRAADYGITIVGDVPIEMGASEATAEVQKIKALNPEAVIFCLLSKDQAAAARGVAAIGWNIPIYGTSATMPPALKMVGADLMEGWRAPFLSDPAATEVVAIINKFKTKYGSTPAEITYFMETWDATNVLMQVFKTMAEKKEPFTRTNLRDALEKYSAGVSLLTPTPRKSPGWKQVPHILIYAKDFLPLKVEKGKFAKY
ncbi:MAG: ABC transporter substrate-binding protein [Candidatus Tectomicrobia bacterium]|uniref:ABC transporter substrate-binding protein n=1 Tax=Tectimicrobiota bacterium TaxID=2528274 RepID=A0A933LRC4_UNCTE|nr:ABC transporter substrate-binding protein [Candidatus Tectomicrobia bacterium]